MQFKSIEKTANNIIRTVSLVQIQRFQEPKKKNDFTCGLLKSNVFPWTSIDFRKMYFSLHKECITMLLLTLHHARLIGQLYYCILGIILITRTVSTYLQNHFNRKTILTTKTWLALHFLGLFGSHF